MKTCTKCGKAQPLDAFYSNPRARDGKTTQCKGCRAIAHREYVARNASRPITDFAQNFFEKVDMSQVGAGCHEWTGAVNNKGYGHMWTNKAWPEMAHHIALRFAGVEPPDRDNDGMVVDHMCRNTRCVSVAHLRIVTYTENTLRNNSSPFALNSQKTHCSKGHPLSGDNIVLIASVGPKGVMCKARVCLTCFPSYRNSSRKIAA